MVADPIDINICNIWSAVIFYKRFSIGSFHLFNILMRREKALETIIILSLASLLIFIWRNINWIIFVPIGLLALSVISKKATIFIGKVWFDFSHYLGIVMSHIILFIIFFIFLIPLALLQRLFRKNQILKKNSSNSFFHKRNHRYTENDIKHPW